MSLSCAPIVFIVIQGNSGHAIGALEVSAVDVQEAGGDVRVIGSTAEHGSEVENEFEVIVFECCFYSLVVKQGRS